MRYFDASALVKRYVRERESTQVSALLEDGVGVVSRLSEAEVSSALARRHRDGSIATADYVRAVAALRSDFTMLTVVELKPPVVARVHSLLRDHHLRAADALQLACCLAVGERIGASLEFVCFDDRLSRAARAEGLRVNLRP
jgi:uncharacterized protein